MVASCNVNQSEVRLHSHQPYANELKRILQSIFGHYYDLQKILKRLKIEIRKNKKGFRNNYS